MTDILEEVASISAHAEGFWRQAHGWAPNEAADLLSSARLHWLASFSRTLRARVQEVESNPGEPADIILAWAHLRTLVEGHLKLYLTVFLTNYLAEPRVPRGKDGEPILPQALSFEKIRQFLIKTRLIAMHHAFIETVQKRGNSIHAFTDKPIGTADEYLAHIPLYRGFLSAIDTSLPLPDIPR